MRPRVPSPRPSRRTRNRKAVDFIFMLLPGSAHEIEIAQRFHEPVGLYPQKYSMRATGGVYLGFYTLRGRKFPHGNFRTTRVLPSQNTTYLRNKVSQISQIPSCDALAGGDFSFIWCFYFMMSLSCAALATMPERASSAMRFGNTIRPLNRSDRFQTRSTCSAEPMTMQTTTIAA